jgi:hypothetical protein
MKKEIRVVNNEKKIVQITTYDERWYAIEDVDRKTGLPCFRFRPSSTWKAGYYPKGIGFYKWLADKGWDEAQAVKEAAGDKGSKVHRATEDIDKGLEVPIDAKYKNPSTGQEEELSVEEIDCIQSFCQFIDDVKPELLACEMTVIGDTYAGTLDNIYRINQDVKLNKDTIITKGIWIVDKKTGQYIWEEHKLQISSYSHANIDYTSLGITDEEWTKRKLAVLQLGYKRNNKNYKFTEIEDKFDLFRMAEKIWENENPEAKPKQKDFPLVMRAEIRQKGGK